MSAPQSSSFLLGSKGNRLLREPLDSQRAPHENDRALELRVWWGDTEIDVQSFEAGRAIRLGSADGYDVPIFGDEVWEGFELVTAVPGSGEAVVHVPPGGELHAFRDGAERAYAHDATLTLTDRCLVSLGTTHLILRWVRTDAPSRSGFFDATDLPFTRVLAIAFLAQLTVWLGFWITPLSNELLSEELFKNPASLTKYSLKAPVTVRLPPITQHPSPSGAPPKGLEGKLGKPNIKKEAPEAPPKGTQLVDAQRRERNHQLIASTAIIQLLSGPAARNVFENGTLDKTVIEALNGLQGGHTVVNFHGMGGMGSRDTGPGGGGTLAGIGWFGSKGPNTGPNGYGRMGFGGMEKKDTRITSGPSVVQGSLSKDLIGKVIKQHWSQIKYCYETELNKDPSLNGKVSMSFTIDGSGAVSQADVAETTMNNRNVENCMVRYVQRWTFPEPKGGGEVIVTYPFIFRAAGSEVSD